MAQKFLTVQIPEETVKSVLRFLSQMSLEDGVVFLPLNQRSSSRQPHSLCVQTDENENKKCCDTLFIINEEIQSYKLNDQDPNHKEIIVCIKDFCKNVVKYALSKIELNKIRECLIQLCIIQKCLMTIDFEKLNDGSKKSEDFVVSLETSALCNDNKIPLKLDITFGVPKNEIDLHISQELSGKYHLF